MENFRAEMDLKVGRSLGCYCTAEGNEYLNWRDSNGDGKKRDDVRNAQRLNLQCLATNWM